MALDCTKPLPCLRLCLLCQPLTREIVPRMQHSRHAILLADHVVGTLLGLAHALGMVLLVHLDRTGLAERLPRRSARLLDDGLSRHRPARAGGRLLAALHSRTDEHVRPRS